MSSSDSLLKTIFMPSFPLVVAKINDIRGELKRFITVIGIFHDIIATKLKSYESLSLGGHYKLLKAQYTADVKFEYTPDELEALNKYMVSQELSKVKPNKKYNEQVNDIVGCLQKLKTSETVITVLKIGKKIVRYKQLIEKKDTSFLDEKTIGLDLYHPIELDFGELYRKSDKEQKEIIFTVMVKFHDIASKVHRLINTSEVDKSTFPDIINSFAESARADLPRCGLGFDLLQSHADRLKNNFDDYFMKKSMSGTPAAFLEAYIDDLKSMSAEDDDGAGDGSKGAGTTLAANAQLMKIIAHARKNFESGDDTKEINKMLSAIGVCGDDDSTDAVDSVVK